MNAPEKFFLHDVQSGPEHRNVRIDAVGIRGLRYPVSIRTASGAQASVATFSMSVALAAAERGTHMSRFVELLQAQRRPLTPARFKTLVADMVARLGADGGAVEMRFAYFVTKTAPVSGVPSRVDYEVCWRGERSEDGARRLWMEVSVPATSLCPCSKEISEYGAHNQRSSIAIRAEVQDEISIEELIGIAERAASCEVYGLLKRPDEKYVTERAYDNPRFVEDIVREVALSLSGDRRIGRYVVEAENFESIHNHSAFARISRSETSP